MSYFDDSDYWRGIILYGFNQATYKIVLGKTILKLAEQGKFEVDWDTLASTFFKLYVDRFEEEMLPQQATPSKRTVIERIYLKYRQKVITLDQANEEVSRDAFKDVIPRFHSIGTDGDIAKGKFYHYDFGKKIYLHDNLGILNETLSTELSEELESRWKLLEGAFSMKNGDWKLQNDIRESFIINGYTRKGLTGNIPFLKAYQGNTCFYCGEAVIDGDIHVDHVLPRQVVFHDEIWNLVISHSTCNMHKEDSLIGVHYLEKLIARNENILGSNHPWKAKISSQLGAKADERRMNTVKFYNNVAAALNFRYWENQPNYNRETDMFYKKLITVLNNG